jgi:hypothetical protein
MFQLKLEKQKKNFYTFFRLIARSYKKKERNEDVYSCLFLIAV